MFQKRINYSTKHYSRDGNAMRVAERKRGISTSSDRAYVEIKKPSLSPSSLPLSRPSLCSSRPFSLSLPPSPSASSLPTPPSFPFSDPQIPSHSLFVSDFSPSPSTTRFLSLSKLPLSSADSPPISAIALGSASIRLALGSYRCQHASSLSSSASLTLPVFLSLSSHTDPAVRGDGHERRMQTDSIDPLPSVTRSDNHPAAVRVCITCSWPSPFSAGSEGEERERKMRRAREAEEEREEEWWRRQLLRARRREAEPRAAKEMAVSSPMREGVRTERESE